MNIWLVILLGGSLTFLTRLSFILLYGKIHFPAWLQRSLKYVPITVLTAITIPELLLHSGKLDFSLNNPRWPAGILAILVSALTRSTLATILAGMTALLLLQISR